MRRRDFMRRLLGGAAAALAGAAVPRDLDAAEMAMLEERVGLVWRDGKLVVSNEKRTQIVVHYGAEGRVPQAGQFWHVEPGYIMYQISNTWAYAS